MKRFGPMKMDIMKYEPEVQSIYTQNIEQMQYAVALTVTSALRGANSIRLYKELEWESVYSRKWRI